MGKAFRGAAVVHLPQASNNAGHGLLLLARLVGSKRGERRPKGELFSVRSSVVEGYNMYVDRMDRQIKYQIEIITFLAIR